jgi:microcystin-dependent protein
MSIIGALPYIFINGTTADGGQVNTDFNTIVSAVNANAAENGVNSSITQLVGLTTPLSPAQGGTAVFAGGTSTGSADVQVLSSTLPNNFTQVLGYIVTMIPGYSNDGITVMTLEVGTTPATNVKKYQSGSLVNLAANDVTAGNGAIFMYDGTQYILLNPEYTSPVDTTPTGVIHDFAGTSAPSGYLPCDGSAVSRTTYTTLFGVIGTTWGSGDGSTTFNVPDAIRSVGVGSGGSGTSVLGNAVGDTGGAETVTLTLAEVPPDSVTVFGNSFPFSGTGNSRASLVPTSGNGNQTFPTNGGGGSHANIQPSYIVLKIIKT